MDEYDKILTTWWLLSSIDLFCKHVAGIIGKTNTYTYNYTSDSSDKVQASSTEPSWPDFYTADLF